MEKRNKKEILQEKIRRLDRKITAMQKRDFRKKKKNEDRRRFLVGVHFYHSMLKSGNQEKMKKIMDGWLKNDRDRVIWNLTVTEKNDFTCNPHTEEIRKKYHIGSYFLEKYREEKRMVELVKLIEYLLKNTLDKRLFLPE